MAEAAEIGFPGRRKDGGAANRPPASSFKGMQRAISKLDPKLLKTVINSCGGSGNPKQLSLSRSSTPPLTIFYDGKVNVFFLGKDTVEEIIRRAEWMLTGDDFRGISSARRKSLQRFLRKRQQR